MKCHKKWNENGFGIKVAVCFRSMCMLYSGYVSITNPIKSKSNRHVRSLLHLNVRLRRESVGVARARAAVMDMDEHGPLWQTAIRKDSEFFQ